MSTQYCCRFQHLSGVFGNSIDYDYLQRIKGQDTLLILASKPPACSDDAVYYFNNTFSRRVCR
ncbi:MAG: hypothetical protein CVU71_09720 [Deltaproteobacteria bacterium HGW-Deltaproteobacteria-6]|nr:MAG: hypothetical protein CVU71_09720 [Deltaproteobacteria bacterium HGW-Deltaproteobacteria-6]